MNPTNRIHVRIPEPGTHTVEVQMDILAIGEDPNIELFLPVWTPGSYLVREYAQFVSKLTAKDEDGNPRQITKSSKSSWIVETRGTNKISVEYKVHSYTLNVRYNHVDQSHAFIHGPATFMYLKERRDEPVEVIIQTPFSNWKVFTGLELVDGTDATYRANDFDTLYDCPFEIGPHSAFEFEACEKKHRHVFWGRNDLPQNRLLDDTKRIVETAAEIFGGVVPYNEYTFMTLLTESSYGGLEHKNSTALMFPRAEFCEAPLAEGPLVTDDKYYDFLALVSHEFFHVWNVKRIVPSAFAKVDYQAENYTRDLWTVEGITSYYDELILLRAGLISPRTFLDKVAKEMTRLERIPGRKACSLEASSFDTWIGLYRPHPHNHNGSVSYYLKGSLISLILDLMIRVDTEGRKTLDDVLAILWQQHASGDGYPENAYEELVEEVIGHEVGSFFDDFIRGTVDPNWSEWFENVGLDVVFENDDPTPNVGFFLDANHIVTKVDADGPARETMAPGDQIVAIDGEQFRGDLEKRVRQHDVGQHLKFHIFRNGRLIESVVALGESINGTYKIRQRADIDPDTAALLKAWLGSDEIED